MSQDYESLLKSAMEKIPKKKGTGRRFQMPQVVVEKRGSKTAIKNFSEIAAALRRDPVHMSRFVAKELAAPASVQEGALVIQARVMKEVLQRKIEDYVKAFVYCKVCGEPDTILEKDDRILFIRCEACGARSAAKNV